MFRDYLKRQKQEKRRRINAAGFEGALSGLLVGGIGALMLTSGVPFGISLGFSAVGLAVCGLFQWRRLWRD